MSQYFKARRKRGACYGTLWKQHSSSIASIVTNSGGSSNILSSMYDFDQQDASTSNAGRSSNSSMRSSISISSTDRSDVNDATVVSGGSQKETSMRNDYLKIIKDQEDHLSNSTTGSSNTNRNTNKYMNHNHNNNAHLSACKRAAKQVLASALEKNERPKSYEFCVLIGNTLTGYENLTAFRRGDHPISEVRIVGASAWNPSSHHDSSVSSSLRSSTSSPSISGSTSNHSTTASSPLSPTSNHSSNATPTFRLLTNAGTHIYCSAQDSIDRDIWLAALHSGLEITYAGFHDTLSTLSSFSSVGVTSIGNENHDDDYEEKSNGDDDDDDTHHAITTSNSQILEPTIITPPLPQRSKRQLSKFVKRIYNSNNNQSSSSNHNSPSQSNSPFLNPYDTSNAPLSKTHCLSCGKYPPEDIVNVYDGTPFTQYGLENSIHVCSSCLIGQGLLRHVLSVTGLYVSDAHERVALVKSLDLMNNVLLDVERDCDDDVKEYNNNNNEKEEVDDDELTKIKKKEKVDLEIQKLLRNPQFAACRHRSRSLDYIAKELANGNIVTEEFIDKLNEYANDAIVSGGGRSNDGNGTTINETIQMKKEALMVAGDMRAAIEMLREHALPKKNAETGYGIGTSAMKGGTEMLSCTLEFFLDLCEQGELKSLAFFWTQICQIHMQMLPPTDTDSLIRVELVEDFLLTVCIRYSVHLALELVWICLADLEESIGSGNAPSASCRRRRFAMLRFVCELESLIFDIDNGWGGGSICLRGMLSPSEHQSKGIKDVMEVLQLHRRFGSHHLTRSARLDKLRSEAQEKSGKKVLTSNHDDAVMDEAERKYQIARNAEYFSTQLMFCRRLSDIAERLFHMDVDLRKDALKNDLAMLNVSGRLGGDPLNNICDDAAGLVNVMHIPCNEGHVFRSKERTPVLLLMEIMSDQKIFETTPNSPKRMIRNDHTSQDSKTRSDENKYNENQSNLEAAIEDTRIDIETLEKEIAQGEELAKSVDLLGISEESICPPSPRQVLLHSPKMSLDGGTPKVVSDMVANVVHEQLKQVQLPDLSIDESNESFMSCNSQQNSNESTCLDAKRVSCTQIPQYDNTYDVIQIDDVEIDPSPKIAKDDGDIMQMNMDERQKLKDLEADGSDADLLQMNWEEIHDSEPKETDEHMNVEESQNVEEGDVDLLKMNNEQSQSVQEGDADLLQMNLEAIYDSEPKEIDESDLDLFQKNVGESQNVEEGDVDLLKMNNEQSQSVQEGDADLPHIKKDTTQNLEHAAAEESDVDLLHMNVDEETRILPQVEVEGGETESLPIDIKKSEVLEQSKGDMLEIKPDSVNDGKKEQSSDNTPCSDCLVKDGVLPFPNNRTKLSLDLEAASESSNQVYTENAITESRDKTTNPTLPRKVSAFGSFKDFATDSKGRAGDFMANLNFGVNGEGRRHVLNTIFVKGMRSSNLIARGVAPAARRAVQAMDRKRAQILINRGGNTSDTKKSDNDEKDNFDMLEPPSMHESNLFEKSRGASEEEECIEAIRLLLVQNRVAIGKLSPENAALSLRKEPLDMKRHGKDELNSDDAGSVDDRLAGCGQVSNAILSAIKLWKDGMVSNGELLELIQKDLQFTKVTIPGSENETILIEDSAFWGRFAFGERWAEKKSRIQSSSTFGAQPGWDLTGIIVKANDDLRQEAFAMQLIELSKEAFEMAGLELWIHPYKILATGRTTGIIEMVRNAMSFDSLKKRPGYNEGGLLGHFKKMAEHAADPTEALMTTKKNFVRSLAAYSLLSYFFLFKDRHNGNLLLDTAGHVIHIDFGFIFGIAPGGSFSLESSVPFKLTEEMIEVMDGLGSVLFSEFVTLFCCGFLAMQAHCETFVTIVKITCEGSTFKCFEGKDIQEIVSKLRERFCPDLNKEATIAHAMELIRQATNALGTKQYDFFQYLSQGIAA